MGGLAEKGQCRCNCITEKWYGMFCEKKVQPPPTLNEDDRRTCKTGSNDAMCCADYILIKDGQTFEGACLQKEPRNPKCIECMEAIYTSEQQLYKVAGPNGCADKCIISRTAENCEQCITKK